MITIKKSTLLIILLIPVIILILLTFKTTSVTSNSPTTNSIITDSKQVIEFTAKGGYKPSDFNAKSDISTILKITTTNTFDCSSSLTIPSLKIYKNLPFNGVTEIELPPQKAGTILKGSCSMGMYNFIINFS